MQRKLWVMVMTITATLLTACQTAPVPSVIKRPNNVFETTGLGKSKLLAQQNALSHAKAQCGRMASPVVLTDTVQYNGVLDESTGRMADQAIGAISGIFGKSRSIARDDDYEYTITFRCE